MRRRPQRPNLRVRNGHRRRELRRQVLAEESVCHICNRPVDTGLPHGQPGSPELDEILPVSLGGSPYDRANIRLAHRICNQRRGNGFRTQRPAATPFITVRQWDTDDD